MTAENGQGSAASPPSTTVKVGVVTRERLRRHDGTADQVINEALNALDREAYRRRAALDILRLAADATDAADLAGLQTSLTTPIDELE